MDQNKIIYKTEKTLSKNFRENVRRCTIKYQNTIIYETQKSLKKCTSIYNDASKQDHL